MAQCNLGGMYDKGIGVKQDYKEAVAWYRKAAEQGHAKAQFNLGTMYDKGQGVKQDHKEEVMWWSPPQGSGDERACGKKGVVCK